MERSGQPARPQRLMALAILINAAGTSLYVTGSMFFLTRCVGLKPVQVGMGLTIAGLLSLAAGIPIGRIADRRGPREVYIAMLLAEALAMAAVALVRSFGAFVLVATLVGLSAQGSQAVRGALIARLGQQNRAAFRARLRSVGNIGCSVGTAAAGWSIHLDSTAGYLALVLGNAASFAATALVVSRIPSLPPLPAPPGAARWTALRDGRYLSVAALFGVLVLQFDVMQLALPLWVAGRTTAPRWSIAPLLLVNTALVIIFQARISGRVKGIAGAAVSTRRAGLAFLLSCSVFAAAAGLPAVAAVSVIAIGLAVHTVGELHCTAGEFEIGYGLAPEHAQGEYQGAFALATQTFTALAPALLATICIGWGQAGWLLLGVVFATAGGAMVPVTRWARHTRALPDSARAPSTAAR